MKDLTGVQDVFCGPQTVIHMKKGQSKLDLAAVKETLTKMKVKVEAIERDDSAVL